MYGNKRVLKSKLRFSGASETIIRDRLMALLSELQAKRLSLVVAGAGYGKTTLVWQAVSYFNLNAVWYRLDKYDSDFETFLRYLIAGIEEHLGDIDIPIEGGLQNDSNIELLLNLLLEEIEKRIQNKLIIVLDDYHLVHDNDEINRAIEYLLENMHHNIQLVLISRSEPPVKISTLRVRREVLDIEESDLAFTVSEIKKLYSDIFYLPLQSKTFTGLQEKTGGWAAALILFFHSLKGKSQETVDNDLLKIKGSHKIISSYLEENAYEMLPSETKEFLVKTSLLSKVRASFCDQLLKINNSKKILTSLEKSHLLTFQLEDEEDSYTYHHIFQEFLRTKIKNDYSKEEIKKVHVQIARLLEQDGDDEEALEHYLQSEQMGDSFRIIGKISNMLWMKGRHQRLRSYIARIPTVYLQKEPWIKYLKSQWLDLSGQKQESEQYLEQAHEAFLKDEEPYGAALCLMRLGYCYLMNGDSPKAEQTYKSAINIFSDDIELTTILNFFSIDALVHQGKFEEADHYYAKVAASLINIQDSELRMALEGSVNLQMGHRYLLSGDFLKTVDFLRKAYQYLENSDLYTLLKYYYFQLSLLNYLMGNFSEGLESAEKGLDLVNEKGIIDFFPSGWLYYFASVICFELDQPIKAMGYIQKSQQIFENIGSAWGRAACDIVFFHIHSHLGDDMEALKRLSQCETVIGDYKVPWVEHGLNVSKIKLYISNNEFEKARQLLESTDEYLKPFGSLSNAVRFVWARYYWMKNNKERAFENLLEGIKTCREKQYYFFPAVKNDLLIHMLVELYADGKEQSYIKSVFNKWGLRSKSSLINLVQSVESNLSKAALELINELPASPLKVNCLGEFKLFCGNEEITAEKWTNKKARLLFKYLLAERNRGFISKDVLIEMLWPEEDIKKTTNRLWVTVSALRKTLEPELTKGMGSSYILNDGDGYKLYLGKDGTNDIESFLEEIRLAESNETDPEKSIPHYIKAESIYQGDFLAEDLYDDWITGKRDYYRDLYLNVITRIIEYYEGRKDYLKCTEYSKKYLNVDSYAENVYQKLMTYYSYSGNTAMVTLTYENCKQNIVDDLCSPLSQKTELLYEELILEQ